MNTLEQARQQIDAIDREMARLFEERMGVAATVAEYKRQNNLPVLDAAREEEVIAKNVQRLQNYQLKPLYQDYLKHLMGLSRQHQQQILGQGTIAYQGAPQGFGHMVAKQLYPHATLLPMATFADVFDAVQNEQTAFGVVPFENSSTGDVSGVLDLCYSHNCYITAMFDLPVSQNLLGLPGAHLPGITTVVSHVQALEQSKRFLNTLQVTLQPFANTALAAEYVAAQNNPALAAVASLEAGERYGLVPLAKDIATEADNTTRFIVISRQLTRQGDRFSLLFTVEHEVGSLAKAIQVIAAEGFDMESIKSRPIPKSPWQYYFYVELVGQADTQKTKTLLQSLQPVCRDVRLLGAYHRHSPATSTP